jgi:hypothetical protein
MDSGAPDYINRVAGVRIWRVAPTLWAQLGGLLWAPNVQEPWPTGEEFYAKCTNKPDHTPPHEGCACGIYGFYTPSAARAGGYWPEPFGPHYNRLVAGVIGAAGEIELSEFGMRSGRASVEAIFLTGADDDELPFTRHEIAEGYGAEVISHHDYKEFCTERGLIVVGPGHLEPPED